MFILILSLITKFSINTHFPAFLSRLLVKLPRAKMEVRVVRIMKRTSTDATVHLALLELTANTVSKRSERELYHIHSVHGN